MKVRRSSAVALAGLLTACSIASASAHARSYVGVQLFALVGVHKDAAGAQYGAGLGPLLQARLGGRKVALHLEGIPVVGIPQHASAFYGQATPSVGIFNATIGERVMPRLSVGFGETVINQRTPLPNLGQVVSSRLAGFRIALRYHVPLRGARVFEANLGTAPTLWGADRYVYGDGVTPTVTKDEQAAEIDASVAMGLVRKESEILFGVRALNFSAKFTATGLAGDRNAGVGVFVEWRRFVR
ncbi:MAG TPA: hypothetical protein VMV73_07005 [Candidatus Dormibacteraeota bacterium]|nr:hypothetical protein [Candidatus Dormibacteraeota bacterium]